MHWKLQHTVEIFCNHFLKFKLMLRHLCSWSKLHIVNGKILPKLIYRLNAIPVKFQLFAEIDKLRPSGSNLTCLSNFLLQLMHVNSKYNEEVDQNAY